MCYFVEDAYAVDGKMGVSWPNSQGPNIDKFLQGQGNQDQNYGNYNLDGQYIWDGSYNRNNNYNRNHYG